MPEQEKPPQLEENFDDMPIDALVSKTQHLSGEALRASRSEQNKKKQFLKKALVALNAKVETLRNSDPKSIHIKIAEGVISQVRREFPELLQHDQP